MAVSDPYLEYEVCDIDQQEKNSRAPGDDQKSVMVTLLYRG